MNPQDPDQPVPEQTPGDAPADAPATPKPRRRRSVAAALATPEAQAPATAEPAAPVASEESPPAKPKRTRRKPAPEADVAEVLAAAPAVTPAPEAPVVDRAEPKAPVLAPVVAAPALAVTPVSAAPSAADGDQAGDEAGGDEAAGEVGGDAAAPGDGPRRRRNRRRGRNKGQGERTGLDEPSQGLAAADGADRATEAEDDDGDDEPAVEPAPTLPRGDVGETFADVVSGAYDAVPQEDVAAEPERRVLAPEPDAPKLHKVLAQSGIGSRRDMEQLIADGRVTVNGQPAHVGQRISFGDQIKVAGKPVKVRIAPPLPRVIAYHKPVGEVVTHDDPQHRPTVFRRLPRLHQGKWQSVGRLDINTEGLLLFTNSGELANQLMHPRFGVEREYAVRVLGTLDADAREQLLEGVEIDGQRAAFKSIADGGGEGVNHWYRVVITEGRNREVRKLFDSVGLGVSRLIRIRYGCVVLPRGLKRGVCVDLNEAEVRELRRLAGGRDGQQAGGRAPQGQGPQEGGGKSRRNKRGGRGGDRADRADRGDRGMERREPGEGGPIPNPLQQTFDKRAIREARQPRREFSEDGPIPNPLEQTYDKRFVQKPRGLGGGGRQRGDQGGGQPDPMKTSVGYIGADAFVRKFQGGGGGGGGGGRGGRRRGGR